MILCAVGQLPEESMSDTEGRSHYGDEGGVSQVHTVLKTERGFTRTQSDKGKSKHAEGGLGMQTQACSTRLPIASTVQRAIAVPDHQRTNETAAIDVFLKRCAYLTV
jgi:hypothetical protein